MSSVGTDIVLLKNYYLMQKLAYYFMELWNGEIIMTDEMRAKVEKVMKNLERNKMKPYFLHA